ncbi:MAG: hypothetical protein KatS3mg077_2346 [Candidatus Binatia bacterium]|nr:MAG: hypothetical protein KatS3mg077_2346 [Candidatus Binatia bacterium]
MARRRIRWIVGILLEDFFRERCCAAGEWSTLPFRVATPVRQWRFSAPRSSWICAMLALVTEVQERLQARRLGQLARSPLVRSVVLLVLLHGPAREALADTLYANDLSDGSPTPASCAISSNTSCSLRAAIMQANDLGGGSHTIVLQNGQTYTLSRDTDGSGHATDSGADNDDLDVTANITIQGNGATIQRSTTVTCNLDGTAAAGEFRIFEVRSGATLTLQNVTVQNGCADGPIAPDAHDRSGGGILNLGTLTVTNCTISANSANRKPAAASWNSRHAQPSPTAPFRETSPLRYSAAASSTPARLTLTNSTISGNSRDQWECDSYNSAVATLNATFVTVANNTGRSLVFAMSPEAHSGIRHHQHQKLHRGGAQPGR